MPASTPLRPLVDTLENADFLDAPAQTVGKAVRGSLPGGKVKDTISGTWFGHALHPPLTDVAIGSLLSASLLDLVAPGSERAAERLLGVGLLAALPTALTGASDWSDTEVADPAVRRVGIVHAGANASALCLFAASWVARRRRARGGARALALAGTAVMTAGGYLGGHMSYTRGVGANQTAFDAGPEQWTAVAPVDELRDGEPKAVVAQDTPVLLLRHGDRLHAVHDRCSHRGCSLSDGDIDGHMVTCSCHGSQFDLTDGSVIRGPATASQPVFEARENDGRVEVRLSQRG